MESRQEVRKREKESRRWNLFHQTNEYCREKTGESKVGMCTQETTEKPKSTQSPAAPEPKAEASGEGHWWVLGRAGGSEGSVGHP